MNKKLKNRVRKQWKKIARETLEEAMYKVFFMEIIEYQVNYKEIYGDK